MKMIKLVINVFFLGIVLSSKLSNFAQQQKKCPSSVNGKCLGYYCSNDAECLNSNLKCANNKCLRKNGVQCSKSIACASRFCEKNKCKDFTLCSNFCPARVIRCKDYCCRIGSDCNNKELGCFFKPNDNGIFLPSCKRLNNINCQSDADCGSEWCDRDKNFCTEIPTLERLAREHEIQYPADNPITYAGNFWGDPMNDYDLTIAL